MNTATQSAEAPGLRLELSVTARRLESPWAAQAPNLSVTVFAATEPEVRERMNAALRFMTETAVGQGAAERERFKAYLRYRGLAWSETTKPND